MELFWLWKDFRQPIRSEDIQEAWMAVGMDVRKQARCDNNQLAGSLEGFDALANVNHKIKVETKSYRPSNIYICFSVVKKKLFLKRMD